ncbi:MAG: alginate export family protein [Planctomycetota bacterium]
MTPRLSALAALTLTAAAPLALAQGQEAPASERPGFNLSNRHVEDWSSFDPAAEDAGWLYDTLDDLKHIDLTDDANVWLSIGGSARLRYEHFENFGFGPANDDGFLLTRVRLHGDLHIGENFRVFVEGKSAFSTDRNLPGMQRTLDNDELALQQAFADFTFDWGDDGTVTLRAGRQQLLFGKQRLVSPLVWSNTMRAWDGVSAIVNTGGWTYHAFWTQFAPVRKYDSNRSDRHTQFFGLYASGLFCEDCGMKADFYFLGLDQDDPTNTYNGTTGAERRYTVGARLFGKINDTGWDYDVEAAYQFGDVGSADINAWMFAGELGYAYGDDWKTRVFVGFDYASGDDTPGDGDVETFNQLFPLGHAYLGYIDVVGRQNIMDFSVGVSAKPMDKLTVRAALHVFWRASDNDALYNAGGGVVRGGGLAGSSYVGTELDLTAKYKIDGHTTLLVGYSHFFAGDFVEDATPAADDDVDYFYAQLQWLF